MFIEFMHRVIQAKKDLWLWPHKRRSRRRITAYVQQNPGRVRLNLGSGYTLIANWLNADVWPYPGTVYLDITRPLPFADGTVELIRCEHLVEHIPYEASQAFLRESYRVLQPGGILRIATPALEKLMDLYQQSGQVPHQELLTHHRAYHNRPAPNMCAWFNDHMRLWGHQFIFDQPTLFNALHCAGFSRIQKCAYGESNHPALRGIEVHDEGVEWMRWAYVMIFEAHKPV